MRSREQRSFVLDVNGRSDGLQSTMVTRSSRVLIVGPSFDEMGEFGAP